jgi:hypothetical protein
MVTLLAHRAGNGSPPEKQDKVDDKVNLICVSAEL